MNELIATILELIADWLRGPSRPVPVPVPAEPLPEVPGATFPAP